MVSGKKFLWFFGMGLLLLPRPSLGGPPTDQLRATISEFVNILANTPVSELRATGLPEAARILVFARFDFSEMTRLSLGQHWQSLELNERAEFTAALANRMLTTYGRTVRSGGENIQFKAEVPEGKQVKVETEVVDGGKAVSIDYQLHKIEGQWKVYDVVIGDVSIVKNFHAQFERVIARSSLKELLQKIKHTDS